jgi:hypothetical protein
MFERGRIDHFGVTDPSVEALHEVRRRLPAEGEGTTDNEVRDFGPLYSLHYVDPDGINLEVNLFKPDWHSEPMLERKDWTTVELDPIPAG